MAVILITHDLGVVAESVDRVMVMYAGKVVEQGSVEDVFERPLHPYTEGLHRSIPRLDTDTGPVHLFGLHLQAEVEYGATRLHQIDQLKQFVDSLAIPRNEPVLIAGDFNVDFYSNPDNHEFDYVRRTLNLGFSDAEPEPSFHSDSNSLLVEPYRQRLDYVFYLKDYLNPINAENQVKFIRHNKEDLSDHHAVLGTFRFGVP